MRYQEVAGNQELSVVRDLVDRLAKKHAEEGNPGEFRVTQFDQLLHVIPAAVKDANGELKPIGSALLDTKISLPQEERSGDETLRIIVDTLSEMTGNRVIMGMIPGNILRQPVTLQASNEAARSVLARFVETTKLKLSWQLFYGPGLKWYVLNVHVVLDAAPPPATSTSPAEESGKGDPVQEEGSASVSK